MSPPAPGPTQRSEPALPATGTAVATSSCPGMSPAREEPHLLVGKRRPARGQGLQPKQPLQSGQQPEERPRAVHAAGDTALHPPPSRAAAGAAPGVREAVAAIVPLLRRTAPAAAGRTRHRVKAGHASDGTRTACKMLKSAKWIPVPHVETAPEPDALDAGATHIEREPIGNAGFRFPPARLLDLALPEVSVPRRHEHIGMAQQAGERPAAAGRSSPRGRRACGRGRASGGPLQPRRAGARDMGAGAAPRRRRLKPPAIRPGRSPSPLPPAAPSPCADGRPAGWPSRARRYRRRRR